MQAAILNQFGTPQFGEFNRPQSKEGHLVVDVRAAAISQFDLAFASGTHYMKPEKLPFVAGFEGVGELEDGRLVYFSKPVSPFGSMAEQTLVSPQSIIEVPEGVDAAVAAVLANSGLAAWLPLSWRAKLEPGETVMILGATGVVGQLAVQSAKQLGAGKILAIGRDQTKLMKTKELGADVLINIGDNPDWSQKVRDVAPEGVDLIIDYLWGEPALAALETAAVGARLVQIGTKASNLLTLSGSLIRNKNLSVMGFASYHAGEERTSAYQELCRLARDGKLSVEFKRVPLSHIEFAWDRQRQGEAKRLVIIP
ncbi:zinc-binding dehydrogenase [Pullulanibacillus sp. KACC 23026]|uniref:quinone oxidoreductase family protein n=1 Tax=Pullulanibacillus sp. KACC 23026 TaxID=3028315 RepID=UPI0023B1204F|nr:zinc-binding dehydrogenase [Pullulanibacillus sp. KACC 23026]WEG14647.1 zinc-binding dehydrogenase [Pullulanibacillus sp. KACC 23026]